jgi:hypothetical protein
MQWRIHDLLTLRKLQVVQVARGRDHEAKAAQRTRNLHMAIAIRVASEMAFLDEVWRMEFKRRESFPSSKKESVRGPRRGLLHLGTGRT